MLEGPDRCGKSTQSALLMRHLRERRVPAVLTREPGGTPFAEAIRKILLDPKHRVAPVAELMLYEAARAQHTFEKVVPALKKGLVVVSERYTLSTVAYQGYGRGIPLPLINRLNAMATGGLSPDLTIVFSMPDEQFAKRSAGFKPDRLELEGIAFRNRVRRGYRLAARRAGKTALINAALPVDRVRDEIFRRVDKLMKI